MSSHFLNPRQAGVRKQPTLVDQVTEGIEQQIRNGHFPLKSALPPMHSLSETWGVSRTVVREALARLAAEGLVIGRQGKGVFVPDELPAQTFSLGFSKDSQEMQRILELRLAVEVEAAGLAALRRTDADLLALEAALDAIDAASQVGDSDSSIAADMLFHRTICSATGNPHFAELFTFLSQFFQTNIAVARRNSLALGRSHAAEPEHRAILDAIRAADHAEARRSARQHLINTAKRLNLDVKALIP
jgi:GntR family transcriptional regulator, transcriptional repressor for pyruvate dehydrogenase complex